MISPPSLAGFPSLGRGRGKGKEEKIQTISADTSRTLVIMSSHDLWSIWSPPFQLRVIAIYLAIQRGKCVFTGSKSPREQQEPQAGSLFSDPPFPQHPTLNTPHNPPLEHWWEWQYDYQKKKVTASPCSKSMCLVRSVWQLPVHWVSQV